ncbi:hypothetical protein EDF62_3038 [Leucobacter luti]|uniref:Uncharacterized protein n=1 Tax=Leucobacter luti TaxID=340320 RepID=A0A4R6RSB5_9MICO|nr:hypothetical protein EDF62_3038 [Leucobacter luti]
MERGLQGLFDVNLVHAEVFRTSAERTRGGASLKAEYVGACSVGQGGDNCRESPVVVTGRADLRA